MGPYFSYSRMIKGACADGKPNRITGVGSWRLLGDEEGVELNSDGVISGGGDGARYEYDVYKGDEKKNGF